MGAVGDHPKFQAIIYGTFYKGPFKSMYALKRGGDNQKSVRKHTRGGSSSKNVPALMYFSW